MKYTKLVSAQTQLQTRGSDKPDPASVTNVVDLSDPRLILDYSRPVRPLALPAEAVLKVIL